MHAHKERKETESSLRQLVHILKYVVIKLLVDTMMMNEVKMCARICYTTLADQETHCLLAT